MDSIKILIKGKEGEMPITLIAGQTYSLSFELVPQEPALARLWGVVTDATSPWLAVGSPLIQLSQGGTVKYETVGSSTGSYTIENIEPGTYDGLITAAGYDDHSFILTLLSSDDMRRNFELSPSTPPTDYLGMSKTELHGYLINGSVAADWWSLPYDYRRQLGLKIIEWWSAPLGSVPYGTKSTTEPDWDPYVDPHPDDFVIQCRGDAAIRYCIMSGELDCPDNLWYFIGGWVPGSGTWYKQEYPMPFHLPVYAATRRMGTSDSHTMCALQVGEDETQFNSWLFFQYEEVDIRPGESWQMPVGATVSVYEAEKIDSLGQLADYIRTLGSWVV